MELKELIVEKLKTNFGESVEEVTDFRDDLSITVSTNKIVDVAKFLKEDDDLLFVMCKDVTAIDWAKRKKRFTVVYHVYSFKNNYTYVYKLILMKTHLNSIRYHPFG